MSITRIRLSEFASSEALIGHLCRHERNACSCDRCVAMCERQPCIGTPQDIERLATAGHDAELTTVLWCVGVPYGLPPIAMVQMRAGRCPMLRGGLCTLHGAGLKPSEGALASCRRAATIVNHPATAVALTWMMPVNRELVDRLVALIANRQDERSAA